MTTDYDFTDLEDFLVLSIEVLVDNPDNVDISFDYTTDPSVIECKITGPKGEIGKILGADRGTVKAMHKIGSAILGRMGARGKRLYIRPENNETAIENNSKQSVPQTGPIIEHKAKFIRGMW